MRILTFGRRSALVSYLIEGLTGHDLPWTITPSIVGVESASNLWHNTAPVDVVINCASHMHMDNQFYVRTVRSVNRGVPIPMEQTNALGAANVALYARAQGAYLIHVSCDRVMGREGPYYDTDRPKPQDDLGISKWAGETAVRAVMKDHPYTIIRFPWLYGARYSGSVAVAAASRKRIAVDDTERGILIHGHHAALALMRLVAAHEHGRRFPQIIHVGNREPPRTMYEYLIDYFPHIDALDDRRKRQIITPVYGLYPSSEGWASHADFPRFEKELWQKAIAKQ